MSIISNVKVYDLNESIIASGYPMEIDTTKDNDVVTDKDTRRVKNLIKACRNDNNAHGQFLTGIRVNFDVTFTNKAWIEAERYRFFEFVSSQSQMHRIAKFDLDEQYIEYVDPRIIKIMNELKDKYNETNNKEDYLRLLYSNPQGFKLTARIATNYRCLWNMYLQRNNHRLPEWREFCIELLDLPMFRELFLEP